MRHSAVLVAEPLAESDAERELPRPSRYRPQLSDAARPLTFTIDAIDERGEHVPTAIAGEHPLTLYIDKRELVTLMTLGAAPEALIIGYLRNQRLVRSLDDIVSVQVDWDVDAARALIASYPRTAQRLDPSTSTTSHWANSRNRGS